MWWEEVHKERVGDVDAGKMVIISPERNFILKSLLDGANPSTQVAIIMLFVISR